MAILFSQADGSDQHYDTYEEFEKAFILLKRLNGEEVPQDLLDEAKAKNSRTEPVRFEINGQVFEDLISSAAEPLGKDANGEDLYEGDYVTGTEANPYGITNSDAICEVVSYSGVRVIHSDGVRDRHCEGEYFGRIDLEEFVKLSDNLDEAKAKFDELNGVEVEDSPADFREGDLVAIKESFGDSFGDVAKINSILPVRINGTGRVLGVGAVLIGDNLDKLRLVCRKEDRKDIGL